MLLIKNPPQDTFFKKIIIDTRNKDYQKNDDDYYLYKR